MEWMGTPKAQGRLRDLDVAENAVRFVVGAGSEVHLVRIPRLPTAAEDQRPEAGNRQRLVVRAPEETEELALRAERDDGAAAEVADQQGVLELAEGARRERQAPRRVDFLAALLVVDG